MVVRQIAGSGEGMAGSRRGARGWDTAAFDATQLYRGDSSNAGRVIHRPVVILPCSANIFRLFVGCDLTTHKLFHCRTVIPS